MAAMYEKELRDKEALARRLREERLHEADGVADRLKAIDANERELNEQKRQ